MGRTAQVSIKKSSSSMLLGSEKWGFTIPNEL